MSCDLRPRSQPQSEPPSSHPIYPTLGSEDIRAQDAPRTRSYRPLSSFAELPSYRSIYDDPVAPQERITVPGYRYVPVHRETYGYSPRPIHNRDYGTTKPSKSTAAAASVSAVRPFTYPRKYFL